MKVFGKTNHFKDLSKLINGKPRKIDLLKVNNTYTVNMCNLGFDASEEFHRYGFRWTESYITWYVDGVPVYRVDEKPNKPLPKTPGRMMTNYWCGTKEAELWMSKYSYVDFLRDVGTYFNVNVNSFFVSPAIIKVYPKIKIPTTLLKFLYLCFYNIYEAYRTLTDIFAPQQAFLSI